MIVAFWRTVARSSWTAGLLFFLLVSAKPDIGRILLEKGRLECRASYEECRNKSVTEVMHYVMRAEIPLDYGPWLTISAEGLDLMKQLTHRFDQP